MFKHLFFLAFSIFCFLKANSSPQTSDYLIHNKDTIPIHQLLVEQYINEYNHSKAEYSFQEFVYTNCWRGYQAIYEIQNRKLFVKHLIGCNELFDNGEIDITASNARMVEVFGDKVINGKVFMEWYSGKLSLPKKNSNILRWDGIFNRIYEEEFLLQFKSGNLKNSKEIINYVDNARSINRRKIDLDSISNILFEEIKKLNWRQLNEIDCSQSYSVTIGGNGSPKKVRMTAYKKDELTEFWDKKEYQVCIKSILKSLKNLKFDVIRKAGKNIEEEFFIELWYNDESNKLENWTE